MQKQSNSNTHRIQFKQCICCNFNFLLYRRFSNKSCNQHFQLFHPSTQKSKHYVNVFLYIQTDSQTLRFRNPTKHFDSVMKRLYKRWAHNRTHGSLEVSNKLYPAEEKQHFVFYYGMLI